MDETAAAVVDVAMLRSLLLRKWSRGISLAQRLASRPPHSRFCGQFPDWVQEAVLRAPPPVAVRLSADRGSKAETRPQDEAAGEGNDSWFGGRDGSSRSVDEHPHRGTAGVFDRLAHRCQWA